MKVLILIFLSVLAYGDFSNFEETILQAMKEKCKNNAQNENAFVELQEAFRNYYTCEQNASSIQPPDPIEDHEGFCNFLRRSGFYDCVENWTQGFAPCLDDNEKYLPHFLLHAVNSTYDELCGAHGVANSKLLFDTVVDKNHCMKGARGLIWGELTCLPELRALKNLDDGIIVNLNKRDVCSDLDSFQTCINTVSTQACADQDYTPILDLMFRPFAEECNELTN